MRDRSPRALRRRALTLTRTYAAFAALTALLPALAAAALAVDVARRLARGVPFTATRMLAFAWLYLAMSAVWLPWFALCWLTAGVDRALRPARLLASAARAQRAWVSGLWGAARGLFDLRVEVDGDEAAEPGPLLVFIRHASLVDVLLPTLFVTIRHGILLRFVLKRELLADPVLDVAGHRLRNHFVGRDGSDTEAELASLRDLAAHLGPRDGVLIYPEGTRFSRARRERLLASDDAALRARAEGYTHVLPPRLGGALALLDAAPTADVLFIAHQGLEGVTTFADLWSGGLQGRVIRVTMWRVPAGDVPTEREARVAWLHAEWARVDAWVAARGGPLPY